MKKFQNFPFDSQLQIGYSGTEEMNMTEEEIGVLMDKFESETMWCSFLHHYVRTYYQGPP